MASTRQSLPPGRRRRRMVKACDSASNERLNVTQLTQGVTGVSTRAHAAPLPEGVGTNRRGPLSRIWLQQISRLEYPVVSRPAIKGPGIEETTSNPPVIIAPDAFAACQSVSSDGRPLANFQLRWPDPCSRTPLILSEAQKQVRSLMGHSINLQDLLMPSPPWQCHGPETFQRSLPRQCTLGLPDVNLLKEYVASYNVSPIRFSFPVIDPALFRDTIELAYHGEPNLSPGTASARACIYAFLSVCTVWNVPAVHPLCIDSQILVSEAEQYIPHILQEETIDGMQTIVMLTIFHGSSGDLQFSLYLASIMARLIFTLHAHVKSPPVPDGSTPSTTDGILRRSCHLRCLFWTAYYLDKELSIRTGQPAAIHDDKCDLTLPPWYEEQLHRLLSSDGSDPIVFEGHLYPTDLRLIKIKSLAYNAFYSRGALSSLTRTFLRLFVS
ncbi:hypothetical protein BBP40_000455 [Aspergillus hancockii]|nr:hypothetical protein BBP40_000455 [Aspergillus hancockii]